MLKSGTTGPCKPVFDRCVERAAIGACHDHYINMGIHWCLTAPLLRQQRWRSDAFANAGPSAAVTITPGKWRSFNAAVTSIRSFMIFAPILALA